MILLDPLDPPRYPIVVVVADVVPDALATEAASRIVSIDSMQAQRYTIASHLGSHDSNLLHVILSRNMLRVASCASTLSIRARDCAASD